MKTLMIVSSALFLSISAPALATGTHGNTHSSGHGAGHSAEKPTEGHMMGEKIYIKGKVEEIDPDTKNITITHEPLVNLDMGAMTMVFRAENDEVFAKLKEGAEIEFAVDRIKGKLTVTDVK
jgi:Cu/Ag efflux protein CusF